jgi:hypothetical protein
MSDNDFPEWPKINRPKPAPPHQSSDPRIPYLRASDDRYARSAPFDDRLTRDDKLFLLSVGIAVAP